MAMASGVWTHLLHEALGNNIALDLIGPATADKLFLVDDTVVLDFDGTSQTYATHSGDEVSGTGWSAGGVDLAGEDLDHTTRADCLVYDATDVSETGTTLTNAEGAIIYAAGLSNECIVAIDFGSAYSTVAGTFAITWATLANGGIFYIDCAP